MEVSIHVILIFILAFLGSLAFRLSLPAIAFYSRIELEASALFIGLLTSIFFIARALSAILSGKLTDKYKHKIIYLVSASFLIHSLVIYLYWYTTDISQVLILRFFQGCLNGLAWIPIQSLLGIIVKPSIRARVYAIYFMLGAMGVMTGNLIYSFMANYPLIYILSLSSIFLILSSVMAFMIKPGIVGITVKGRSEKVYGKISLEFSILLLLAIVFSTGMFNSIVRGDLIYIYMKEGLNLSKASVAQYIAIASLIGLVIGYAISWIADKLGSLLSLRIATIILLSGSLTLSILINWASFIALTLVYVGTSSIVPIARKIGVGYKGVEATLIGLINALANVGNVIGSALAGYLYDIIPNYIEILSMKISLLIPIMAIPIVIAVILIMIPSKVLAWES